LELLAGDPSGDGFSTIQLIQTPADLLAHSPAMGRKKPVLLLEEQQTYPDDLAR
jgi:hypothetical protein